MTDILIFAYIITLATIWEVGVPLITWQALANITRQINVDTLIICFACIIIPLFSCITWPFPNFPIKNHGKLLSLGQFFKTFIREKVEVTFFHNERIATWIELHYVRMIIIAIQSDSVVFKSGRDVNLATPNAGARLFHAVKVVTYGHASSCVPFFVCTVTSENCISVTTSGYELVSSMRDGKRRHREEWFVVISLAALAVIAI